MRRYADVKQEMLAQNNDPSRDVLQTLLNPYEGFDDTERKPHPFQIKRDSKLVKVRKNSKNALSPVSSNFDKSAAEDEDNLSLKELLQS